jgi:hypothetical protein
MVIGRLLEDRFSPYLNKPYKKLSPQRTQSQIIQRTKFEKGRSLLGISIIILLCALCGLGG